jgi:hypothetical protein
VAREISDRLTGTFLTNVDGRRPVHGGQPILQSDPYWRDFVLFYEYFHGDNGAGIGASHQTGWTGTMALLPPAVPRHQPPRHCAPAAVAPSRARQRAGGEGWRDDRVAGSAGDL